VGVVVCVRGVGRGNFELMAVIYMGVHCCGWGRLEW